jgi:hypothetical protein
MYICNKISFLSLLYNDAYIELKIGWLMNTEQLVEWKLAGKIEVLGENLPVLPFVHHKPHVPWPGTEPGPPRWEADD